MRPSVRARLLLAEAAERDRKALAKIQSTIDAGRSASAKLKKGRSSVYKTKMDGKAVYLVVGDSHAAFDEDGKFLKNLPLGSVSKYEGRVGEVHNDIVESRFGKVLGWIKEAFDKRQAPTHRPASLTIDKSGSPVFLKALDEFMAKHGGKPDESGDDGDETYYFETIEAAKRAYDELKPRLDPAGVKIYLN